MFKGVRCRGWAVYHSVTVDAPHFGRRVELRRLDESQSRAPTSRSQNVNILQNLPDTKATKSRAPSLFGYMINNVYSSRFNHIGVDIISRYCACIISFCTLRKQMYFIYPKTWYSHTTHRKLIPTPLAFPIIHVLQTVRTYQCQWIGSIKRCSKLSKRDVIERVMLITHTHINSLYI